MLSFNSDHFSRPVWRRRPLLGVAISAAWCMLTGAQLAQAQSAYPQRPILMVVPQAAGGTNDIVGRLVSQKLSEVLGSPVAVENRPGGRQHWHPVCGQSPQRRLHLAHDHQQQPGHQPGAVQEPGL